MFRITLENWMCHPKLDLLLSEPVAFVIGSNRRGKSAATRDAVEFVFLGTGALRGITTKKELAQRSILDGAGEATVTVETARTRVARSMKLDAEQQLVVWQRTEAGAWDDGREIPMKEADSAFFREKPDLVRALLDPGAFFALDATRRREILIAATSDGAPLEAVAEALKEALLPLAKENEAAAKAAGPPIAKLARLASERGFRAAEAHAIEERKAAKRERDGIASVSIVDAYDGVDLRAHPLADFEARLATVIDQHQTAIAAAAATAGAARGQLEEAEREYAALLKSADEGKEDEGASEELQEAAAERAKLEADLATIETALAELRGAATAAETFTKPKLCPAVPAPAELLCPVKEGTFQKALDAAADRRRDAEHGRDAKESERNAKMEPLARAREREAAARKRLEAELARAAAAKALHDRADALEARIATLGAQAKEPDTASRPAEGPTVPDLARSEERGRRIVAAKRAHDLQVRQGEIARTAQEAAEARIALWDALAQALKPDGVETALGGGARAAFEAHLAQLEGLTAPIEIDSEFVPWVHWEGERRHVLSLSDSHQRAVGTAIQHALAQLVQFPVLVCDQLDLYKGEWLDAWVAAAKTIAPLYTGGVIGVAASDADPPEPPPEGFCTAWLRPDGTAVVLGADFERGAR